MTNISSYEITKISKGLMPESTLPFLDREGSKTINVKYFTSIKNDILKNFKTYKKWSLAAPSGGLVGSTHAVML